jgi:arylsulfate sulfotransferase
MHAINGFHHEARKLKGGGYLVLADSERILTDVQGSGDVDVIGDTILVLDDNLQVTWAWDAFDHLDPSRAAILGETCTAPDPGCAPWYLATTANDWLHGNALQLTPDGNILYSTRHQDWVIKIDYQNGTGSGGVLWRLGKDGDFQIASSDPSPWFSHQHDANFEPNNRSLILFDDGNTRKADDPTATSRGQVLSINEDTRIAKLVMNADLGSYSAAVGSAQKLPNGNFHFDSGFIQDAAGKFSSQSVEVDRAGSLVFAIQFTALEYRTFRMRDLYTEP